MTSGATTVAGALTLGTQLAVAQGGTGATSLTDGGVLLGSSTSAVTAMGVLSDSEMIVGDGATDPVAESGDTLRISIGVGSTASGTVMQVYSANTTANVRFARGVAIGYANSKVPGSNLDVKGNAVISSNVVASSLDVTNYFKVVYFLISLPPQKSRNIQEFFFCFLIEFFIIADFLGFNFIFRRRIWNFAIFMFYFIFKHWL